jgi:hypothetical protein
MITILARGSLTMFYSRASPGSLTTPAAEYDAAA